MHKLNNSAWHVTGANKYILLLKGLGAPTAVCRYFCTALRRGPCQTPDEEGAGKVFRREHLRWTFKTRSLSGAKGSGEQEKHGEMKRKRAETAIWTWRSFES